MGTPWNHNLHYLPVALEAMPDGCARALDVGCGEGTVARRLRVRGAQVTAIDVDERSIELAREAGPSHGIEYVVGDFASHPFTPGSFDFVVCVAALHHMAVEPALRRMSELVRPGGVLAILGLARSRYPHDLFRDAVAVGVSYGLRLRHGYWESPAPARRPPSETYGEVRSLAARVLPGSSFRRHLIWRYSILWTKP